MRDGSGAQNTREHTLDDWLRQQVLPAYDAYRADPARGIALEEVRASIGKRNGGAQSVD